MDSKNDKKEEKKEKNIVKIGKNPDFTLEAKDGVVCIEKNILAKCASKVLGIPEFQKNKDEESIPLKTHSVDTIHTVLRIALLCDFQKEFGFSNNDIEYVKEFTYKEDFECADFAHKYDIEDVMKFLDIDMSRTREYTAEGIRLLLLYIGTYNRNNLIDEIFDRYIRLKNSDIREAEKVTFEDFNRCLNNFDPNNKLGRNKFISRVIQAMCSSEKINVKKK